MPNPCMLNDRREPGAIHLDDRPTLLPTAPPHLCRPRSSSEPGPSRWQRAILSRWMRSFPRWRRVQSLAGWFVVLSMLVACGQSDLSTPSTAQSAQVPTTVAVTPPSSPVPATDYLATTLPQQGTTAAIPACIFDANAVPLAPDPLTVDDFTFDAPQVVATAEYGISVDEWLPDSQHLLFSWGSYTGPTRTIALLDTATDQVQPYATTNFATWSHWSTREQGVVFVERQGDQLRLNLSRDPILPSTILSTSLGTPFFTIHPDGTSLTVTPNQATAHPQMIDLVPGRLQAPRELAGFTDMQSLDMPITGMYQYNPYFTLQTVWSPDGQRAVVYNYEHTYLVDIPQHRICALNLGAKDGEQRWALNVKWSSDGRFLAATTTTTAIDSIPFVDLTIVNLQTGAVQHLSLESQIVDEIVWLPDSHMVVATGRVQPTPYSRNKRGLFLIDALRGTIQRVLPDEVFAPGLYGTGTAGVMSIAPDGQALAIACSLYPLKSTFITEFRLCTIRIHHAN